MIGIHQADQHAGQQAPQGNHVMTNPSPEEENNRDEHDQKDEELLWDHGRRNQLTPVL